VIEDNFDKRELFFMRIVWPLMAKASGRYWEYADHGPKHVEKVRRFINLLGHIYGLEHHELELARLAAIAHDLGMVWERETHEVVTGKILDLLSNKYPTLFGKEELPAIKEICLKHRTSNDEEGGDYNPDEILTIKGKEYRSGLIISLLRVADGLDMDYKRVNDYSVNSIERDIIKDFDKEKERHLSSLDSILGVRILCDRRPCFEIFTNNTFKAVLQINRILNEIQLTPLRIPVHIHIVRDEIEGTQFPADSNKSLVCSYFSPSGIITACISKKNIGRMIGDPSQVEIWCHPEKTRYINKFWSDLNENNNLIIDKSYKYINFCDLPLPIDKGLKLLALHKIKDLTQKHMQIFYSDTAESSYSVVRELVKRGVITVINDTRNSFVACQPQIPNENHLRLCRSLQYF